MSRVDTRHRTPRVLVLAGTMVIAALLTPRITSAEERPFAVMLAHSPKSFAGALPPGGLGDAEIIRKAYFDRNLSTVDSFAEYWEEISYGDVQVTGDVLGWVTIPWAFDPTPPNGPARPSAADYIDLFQNRGVACDGAPNAPGGYAYGAGEEFCDCQGGGGPDTVIGPNTCGAMIIRQIGGDTDQGDNAFRQKGLVDFDAVGVSVWTPGERFIDVDDDSRWDGLDEKNDRMCHKTTGCPVDADGEDVECTGGGTDGPCGCDTNGCGDLLMPGTDWDGDGALLNCPGEDTSTFSGCIIPDDLSAPTNCLPPIPGQGCGAALPECCNQADRDERATCEDGGGVPLLSVSEGINCVSDAVGTPLFCCEYDDADGDNAVDVVEPFEDFIVRWNPKGTNASRVWVPVTEEYIEANYPGDVVELQRRTGNGYYDPSDMFFDTGSTKMMQDAGLNQFAWATPKPGARFQYSGAPNFETPWFDTFWTERYGSTVPAWPGGSGPDPAPNSPIMRPFDPAQPNPPVVLGTAGRRWFKPDTGGWSAEGDGTAAAPAQEFSRGSDAFIFTVLPEETFGYYDGWVEHDDLASSKYHHAGDKRLGEITLPRADTVTPLGTATGESYTAIFGADLGRNDPNQVLAVPDNFCVAAGPGAINIHGEKGFDAGDVCLVEWLTWRTDGTSSTVSSGWEFENGRYHPFAGPSSKLNGGPVGFRDYNLDGMIDQGEVRPELSESYSVDPNPFTSPNDGQGTDYPFNRRRLLEDVVEAMDVSVSWTDFKDRFNRVSGIVLVPPNAFSDVNLFPLSPSYFPIHTEDAAGSTLRFHDLVTCQSCRDFPGAVGYSAHEYLHTWEGYPDLYDYDIFNDPQTDVVNCPIGAWDIMAASDDPNSPVDAAGLVHPMPFLKRGSGWIDAVDLRSLLTPGVETTLTLPPAELVRDNSYFFMTNEERPGENYWFWSAGSGFDTRFPGSGLLIVHTDVGVDPNALPLQQRSAPFNYEVVQADGRRDLEACSSSGNGGDAGDPWPGTSNATRFALDTVPSAVWNTDRWTGLEITNIVPDGAGSTRLTLSWIPTNIPGLRFVNPPGGSSSRGAFQINYDVTDVHGGTTIRIYATQDKNNASPTAAGTIFVGQLQKPGRGTSRLSTDWRLAGVPDGQWFVFAKLIPGPGVGGAIERSATNPRVGRNNVGNGSVAVQFVNVGAADANTARFETWTAECIKADGTEWRVNSGLTQPEPADDAPNQDPFPHAFTGQPYTSIGGEVRFLITAGTEPFTIGDTFAFTTTGITARSRGVLVFDERVTGSPVAKIAAAPLSGRPPFMVSFDASASRDPQGEALRFEWDFGDGSPVRSGVSVDHTFTKSGTFTVALTATNPRNGRFGQAAVDVNAINNSPRANLLATPSSGTAPLLVRLSAADSSDTETPSNALVYQWDFGDGTTGNDLAAPGVQIQVSHTYNARVDGTPCTPTNICTFNVTLTVTDEGGKQSTATATIVVGNSNPVASVTASPLRGTEPLEVRFNASGSTDADGDDLTVVWHWDDGTPDVTLPLSGTDGDGNVTHTYAVEGFYSPTATVNDSTGGSTAWPGVDITVTAPVAGSSDPRAIFHICAQAPCNLTDSELPVLNELFAVDGSQSLDRPAGGSITAYSWNWGDGSTVDSGVTATHTYTTAGTFTIKLTVTDAETPPNTASFSRIATVEEDGGGSDPDNEPPVPFFVVDPPSGVASETEFRFDASGSNDPDGDNAKLSYSWSFGDGARGAGRVVRHLYTTPNQNGFVVRLTVRDEKNASRSLTDVVVVTETSGNRRPVAVIGSGPRAGSAPFTLTLDASNSFDSDGDPLEYRWEFREAGDVIDVLAGASVSRTFADSGTFEVELRVSDGRGGVDFAGPQPIRVTPRVALPVDPGTGQGVPGDGDPAGIPDSANQRSPLMCGLGMLMGMIGSLVGLTLMAASRRRRR